MNKERFEISVNQEDVQNIINCYEKDIEYIKQLEDNWNKLKEWLEEEITNDKSCTDLITRCLSVQDLIDEKQYILDKMQEIEGGMNE